MAFMFETRNVIVPTEYALASPQLQGDYQQCWAGIGKNFRLEP
jgi:homogentisate 1,2-dioxygenase